jgi:ERCC4-related helicase
MPKKTKTLWAHQALARQKYKDSPYFGLLFDCGIGKTLTALMIAQDKFTENGMNCLVIAPDNLLNQWERTIHDELEVPHTVFKVLPKSAQRKNYEKELDEFLSS